MSVMTDPERIAHLEKCVRALSRQCTDLEFRAAQSAHATTSVAPGENTQNMSASQIADEMNSVANHIANFGDTKEVASIIHGWQRQLRALPSENSASTLLFCTSKELCLHQKSLNDSNSEKPYGDMQRRT